MKLNLRIIIQNFKEKLPPEIRFFLTRVFVLFICWKLIYHLFLFPYRILDKPLTNITTQLSSYTYEKLYKNSTTSYFETIDKQGIGKAIIYINHKRSIGVGDNCNGLELHILFIGFLFCFRTTLLKKIKFIAFGGLLTFILNVLRVTFLARMNFLEYKYADFAHHYLFKMIIYSIIFLIWIYYIKNIRFINEDN